MTDTPPKRTLLDLTLRGLDEVERFPTPQARARALEEFAGETRGWDLVKGIVISASAMLAVAFLVRAYVPVLLPGVLGPFIIKDLSLLLGVATLLAVIRWLHRRGAARALRPKLIAAGVPVCIECGYALRGLPTSTALCPECGTEITAGARGLLVEESRTR